jgi:hypothetical protein
VIPCDVPATPAPPILEGRVASLIVRWFAMAPVQFCEVTSYTLFLIDTEAPESVMTTELNTTSLEYAWPKLVPGKQ